MLVPSTRLLVWVAIVVLPFAALAGTAPGAAPVAAAVLALFAAVAAADALSARSSLRGIRVLLPELTRLQKDRPGSFDVRIQNETQLARPLRLGLAFPAEFEVEECDRTFLLPAGTEFSALAWKCTARRRGQFFLEQACVEGSSPLGLWAVRARQPVRGELRVYPNLFDERKNVAALFLRRGQVGAHALRQAGQGREFEKLRDYVSGDSVTEIHWKASAKRGHPVTKVFQVERTQEVYVVVDASRLTARSVDMEHGATTNVLERYVTAALLLGLAAEQKGDQFGLLTFSDRILGFVRAKSGQAHYDACRERLYTLQPQMVSPDFDELATFIRLRLRKRALLIFLTALDDPMLAEGFVKSLDLVARQHLVMVNMLQPPGAVPVFSQPAVNELDDVYRQLGGHWQWQKLRELGKVLRSRGVRFGQLNPVQLPAQLIAQYSDAKARQLI